MKKYLSILLLSVLALAAAAMTSCEKDQEVIEYSINITLSEGGSVAVTVDGAAVSKAVQGDEVTLTATPGNDYTFVRWTVEKGGVQLSGETAAIATFTMPAEDVSVKAEFKLKPVESEVYNITITDDGKGTAEASIGGSPVTEASEGAEITLTATPGEGYLFGSWKIEGGAVELSGKKTNPATFTMPAEDVSIKAMFVEVEPENILDKIPDQQFYDYCLIAFDTNQDGILTSKEAKAVKKLDAVRENEYFVLWKQPVATLEGIEYFTEIEILYCYNNEITELDLSKNTKLKEVVCFNNKITSIDVSNCPDVELLYCRDNLLTTIDTSGNPALNMLLCHSNKITSLDVSNNPALHTLACNTNQLTSLDVSNNKALEIIECHDNRMTVLDASVMSTPNEYPTIYIYCGNQRAGGTTPQTMTLTLREDQKPYWYSTLAAADKNGNVKVAGEIDDIFEAITDPVFKTYCARFATDGNGKLSRSEADAVTVINTGGMSIESMNGIEYFKNLTVISCPANRLTSLDVSGKTALTDLICPSNKLSSLNISGCTALQTVIALNNRLSTLDASDMSSQDSYSLQCGNQTADGSAAQVLAVTLRDGQKPYWYSNLAAMPENKYAVLAEYVTDNIFDAITDSAFREYCKAFDTNEDGILSMLEGQAVEVISAEYLDIVSMAGIEYFTRLTVVNCPNNKLTALDVSNKPLLQNVICYSNQLTSLNISGCRALSSVIAFYNNLAVLDASDMGNPGGYNLLCGANVVSGTTTTPQTMKLTLRAEQKPRWEALKNQPQNADVVLAD